MVNILGIPDPDFRLLVFLIELLLGAGILTGWYLGARRLNINLHHLMVYSAVAIQVVIVTVWMLPRALQVLPFILQDIPGNLLPISHLITGPLTVIGGITLAVLFLVKREIPLKLLKRVKPLMIAELILWITTLAIRTWMFLT